MKPSRTIKLKALFLLVSFSLNSVVGFACSLGADMGFNSNHHSHEGEEKQEHKHDGHDKGHNNHHHEKAVHKHNHEEGEKHDDGNTAIFKAPLEDNCCKDFVVGFQSLDKQLFQKANPAKHKFEYTPLVLQTSMTFNKQVYTEPVRIPPKIPYHSPPDIRVFIQSFLI